MSQNPNFVPDVPGLCRALCRVYHPCAGCAGSPTYARTGTKTTATTQHKCAHMRIYTRHTRHTRHMLDSYTFFHTSPGTASGTPGTGTPTRAPNYSIHLFESKKWERHQSQRPPAPSGAPLTTPAKCSKWSKTGPSSTAWCKTCRPKACSPACAPYPSRSQARKSSWMGA